MKFNFTQNRTVADLATVPENLRAFYEEAEGDDSGFTLKTDGVTTAAVAVISGLSGALTKARAEVDTAKKTNTVDLTSLGDYGTTVEEITAGVAKKIEELAADKDHSQKSVSDRISQIQKEHSEALTKLTTTKDAELKAKDGVLHTYMLDQAITNAGSGWEGLNTKLIAPFARENMAIHTVDEKARVVVLGTDGEARYSKMAERAGELMQPDELLTEMSEQKDYKQLFPSQQLGGGGGSQQNRTPPGVRRTDKNANLSPAQKITASLNKAK
jgi:hypothetical protein